jgi:hypothetical protein
VLLDRKRTKLYRKLGSRSARIDLQPSSSGSGSRYLARIIAVLNRGLVSYVYKNF